MIKSDYISFPFFLFLDLSWSHERRDENETTLLSASYGLFRKRMLWDKRKLLGTELVLIWSQCFKTGMFEWTLVLSG